MAGSDIRNTDMMLIMGGNPAENTRVVSNGQRSQAASQRQDHLSSIRSSRHRVERRPVPADRAGADIASRGLVNYAIQNGRIAHDIWSITQRCIHREGSFKLPEDRLYSGFDEAHSTYEKQSGITKRRRFYAQGRGGGAAIGGAASIVSGNQSSANANDAQHKAGQTFGLLAKRVRRQSLLTRDK